MNIKDFIRTSTKKLNESGVSTSQLDVEVLLADIFDKDRSWVHAHSDRELQDVQIRTLNEKVERRAQHEPLAYIRGKQEFFGRDFYVSPDTLTPRPETETMVELVLSSGFIVHGKSPVTFVDVGTGSGCIIITLALELASQNSELRTMNYLGLDISKPALKIAQKNAKKHNADVSFKEFDLLNEDLGSLSLDLRGRKAAGSSKIQAPSSTIYLANLPYVPENFKINLAASHEPAFAIYGGKDGLDYYRALFSQLKDHSCTVFTESLPPQHEELANIAKQSGFKLQKTLDFIQVFAR